jgi:hypothetical protein
MSTAIEELIKRAYETQAVPLEELRQFAESIDVIDIFNAVANVTVPEG